MTDASPVFVRVRGHAAVQASLSRAIARDQLHHGLIFVGPRGVGKAALARGLGCALHCHQAPARGCGTCDACRRVLSGVHTGVEWLRPEGPGAMITVGTARELANRLELAPFEGDRHLVVFDPADALNEQAYNALLKAIEEPRPGVHFVMLTTGLDALLPTILSRCLTVRLGRLDDDDVRAILQEVLRERGDREEPVTDDRLELAVRSSDGSAGVAVELALDPSLEEALELVRRLVEASRAGPSKIFGGDKSPLWSAWAAAVGPVKSGKSARERAVAARACELWLLHLRENIRGRDGLPDVEPMPGSSREVLRALDRIQSVLEGLSLNHNARLALEQCLLDLHP